MTDQQYKLCKIIMKEKRLNKILESSHIDGYQALQFIMKPYDLHFDDINDPNTTVVLLFNAQAAYDSAHRVNRRATWSIVLSVASLIVSTASVVTTLCIALLQNMQG